MSSTTITVDVGVRDRLVARAHHHGRAAGVELAALLDRVEVIEAWSRAATDFDALPTAARAELHEHEPLASGASIRSVVVERGHVTAGRITESQLDEALDVLRMTHP